MNSIACCDVAGNIRLALRWGGYLQWDEGVSVVCVEPAPKETNRR